MSAAVKFTLALAEALASADGHVRVLRQEMSTIRAIVARNYPDALDILSSNRHCSPRDRDHGRRRP